MNPHLARALADQRQAELRQAARRPRIEPPAAPAPGLRHRLGIVLVEAGLHLITRGEAIDRPRFSAPAAR
jgi:hypothetical protein